MYIAKDEVNGFSVRYAYLRTMQFTSKRIKIINTKLNERKIKIKRIKKIKN